MILLSIAGALMHGVVYYHYYIKILHMECLWNVKILTFLVQARRSVDRMNNKGQAVVLRMIYYYSLEQQICVYTVIVRKTGPIHLVLVDFTPG